MERPAVRGTQSPFPGAPASPSGWTAHERTTAHGGSDAALWRPWIPSRVDAQRCSLRSTMACPYGRSMAPWANSAGGKAHSFQHPVRLFWPKSKSFDYLYSDGEVLLRNLPVQATISFYDESDSEDDEDDEEWEEEDRGNSGSCRKPQITDFI